MKIDKGVIQYVYEVVLSRDCTPLTISVKIDHEGVWHTGGSKKLVPPIHSKYSGYMSLQEYIDKSSKK